MKATRLQKFLCTVVLLLICFCSPTVVYAAGEEELPSIDAESLDSSLLRNTYIKYTTLLLLNLN